MDGIRNIVFDLGGILVSLDAARSIDAFRRIGCGPVARYVEEHRTEDLFLDIELGRTDTAGFCRRVREITATTVTDALITEAWDCLLTDIPQEKLRCVARLRDAGYRLFLLSNTNEMHWARAVRLMAERGCEAGDLFEHAYLSHEMHLAKPDPAIFQAVLTGSALRPEETLFIDDLEANCAAAAASGMRTLHDPTGSTWAGITQKMTEGSLPQRSY